MYDNDDGDSYPVEYGKLSFAVIDFNRAKTKTEANVG